MSKNISAFLAEYKTKKTDEDKINYVKSHVIDEYIPYEKKVDFASAIVQSSYYEDEEPDTDDNSHKVFHVDSVAKYMLTCMALVDLFTDIERQRGDGNILNDFNALNKARIFDLIIQCIDPQELKEFRMILQMECDDLIANEYENHAFISKQVERFGSLIGTIIQPLLSQLDTNKLEEIMSKITI